MQPEMTRHTNLDNNRLHSLIRKGEIRAAGNVRLKIYGTLHCRSGKRMKKVNRVFFVNLQEAEQQGFRPCAHCMHREYHQWKSQQEMG